MDTRHHHLTIGTAAAWVAIGLTMAACAGATQATPPGATAATSPAVSASPTPSPAASPTHVVPDDAAPEALQGRWKTSLGSGDDATLFIYETAFKVVRGVSDAGKFSVTGNVATFGGVSGCDVVGTYEWAISGGILTFTPIEPRDTCRRADVLIGHDFERAQ